MTRLLRRPTYADVVGTLALLVAMSGTAYAAHALPKNSVGPKQLKASAVSSKDVKDGGIAAADLAAASVGAAHLQTASVGSAQLAPDSVGTAKLQPSSVGSAQLAPDSVGTSHLKDNAVGSDQVADNSISLNDVAGIDDLDALNFSLPANTCGTVSLTVSGAVPGQAAVLSFTDVLPSTMLFSPLLVSSPDQVVLRACNVGAAMITVTDLGIRVVTFG